MARKQLAVRGFGECKAELSRNISAMSDCIVDMVGIVERLSTLSASETPTTAEILQELRTVDQKLRLLSALRGSAETVAITIGLKERTADSTRR